MVNFLRHCARDRRWESAAWLSILTSVIVFVVRAEMQSLT
jgi:hypothetical protein